jgi:hypothetical protein
LFRSILAAGGIVLGGVLFASCASTRPEDVPVPAPILAKTVWDDASGRSAPADSIGRNLSMMLRRRDDLVVLSSDSQPAAPRPHAEGGGGGHHRGSHHGGGAMAGESEYGGGHPERGGGEVDHHASSLRLLLAGTVERWDVDSERAALDASFRPASAADSLRGGPFSLSLRLVSKATGRVAWKKTEDCPPAPAGRAAIADSVGSLEPGWLANFSRCREEILHSSSLDVAQAALDLARKAAISEAESRADR